MKKYVIIGSVVVAVLLVMLLLVKIFSGDNSASQSPQASTEIPAEAFEPDFTSQTSGFRVQGPDGWLKKADNLGMLVTYLNPAAVGGFQENISLAEEAKGDLALEAYAQESLQQIINFFPGYELLSQEEALVQNRPALRVRYKLVTDQATLVSEQVIIDRPENWLVITLISEEDRFEQSLPSLKTLENSLVFIDRA